MSLSSSVFREKQSEYSLDIEDCKQMNKLLQEQNTSLKQSIEELIRINNTLTDSIEEFNTQHQETPQINQEEIAQLAHQVIELQKELEMEKIQRDKERQEHAKRTANASVEEMLQVIQELVMSFRSMHEQFQADIERVQAQLHTQKNEWLQIAKNLQLQFVRFQHQYDRIYKEVKKSQGIIATLQQQLQSQGKNYLSKKELKISTTIEDLKQTLDKQIEDKNRVIKMYEHLLEQLKGKLLEKIGGA